MLEAFHPYGDYGYVKVHRRTNLPHSGVLGSNPQHFKKQAQSPIVDYGEEISPIVVYKIVGRTIKRNFK
jgi:hypothetical protein